MMLIAGGCLFALVAFIFLNNTNLFASRAPGTPVLLAHRGLAQNFDRTNLQSDTCTAERMLPTDHDYLENTIPSMEAAFDLGADVVEIDVHPTTDGAFAVFHDWRLDCRTEGHGATRDHSLAELKALDVGYGYTADGGKTHPFRGRGEGLMPSLDEVLATFPDRDFLINVKSGDPEEGALLAARLAELYPAQRDRLMAYGDERPLSVLRAKTPDIRTLSKPSIKACLMRYIAYGWTGIVPGACKNKFIAVPINVAPWLWGWPDRFLNRMEDAGSRVFVQGDYHGGWSTGIDTPEDLARLPEGYSGGILTDRIEVIAPAVGWKPAAN
ncbi:MAG TPA: glycerophosphodiester phosphodiesterase family protein [Methyloceanibacter sp.]|nr:glycerophosphodiester phosphodiesterase family protein [Methyloceanibacter sp.]